MHKPSISRINLIASIAATLGFTDMPRSTAEVFQKARGPAPAGMRYRYRGCFVPGGPNPNVEPTKVKNPLVAANVNMMHEKWLGKKIERIQACMAQLEKLMEPV